MTEYRRRFRKKLNELNNDIEKLSDLTIKNYKDAIKLFDNFNEEKYERIESNTEDIVEYSSKIEQKCITILATEQPVAKDLRFVENSIKMGTHLRRISKLSVDIARVANEIDIVDIPAEPLESMKYMSKEVENMLTRSTRSFVSKNVEEALELEEDDDVVDDLFDEFLVSVTNYMKKDKNSIDILVPFLLVSRYLERIADRSESIGGRVIQMNNFFLE